jgi:hypothetical protein
MLENWDVAYGLNSSDSDIDQWRTVISPVMNLWVP